MNIEKYIAQKAQQASKNANNSTGISGAVSDYVKARAEKQQAEFDKRNKNRSAERAALEAAGDRAVLDFIKSVSQPEQPKATTQKTEPVTVPDLRKNFAVPYSIPNASERLQINANRMPSYMQGERSDQAKREKAIFDVTAGKQKVMQLESEAVKVQERGQKLQTQSAALEQSHKNIMALKQKYEQTGDEVSGRAYLLAVEMYNQNVNAYQKEVEIYNKESKVLADYEKAWQDLQLKQMAYQDIEDQIAAKKPENKPAEELRGMIDDLDKQIMAAEQKVAPLRQKTITKNGRDLTPENQQAQMQLQQVYAELQGLKQQKKNLQGYLERRESLDWESSKEQEILEAGGEELMAALIDYAQEIELGQRFTFDKGVAAAAKTLKDMGVTDEQLQKWMPYARRMVSAETYEQQTGLAKELAQSSRLGEAAMSVASVPYNLTGGLGIVDVTLQKLQQKITGSDTPINYKSRGMTGHGIADAIRTGVTENIEARTEGKAGSNTALGNLHTGAYNLVMSMADSLGVVGLTAMGVPGATLLLGGSAATATMQEVKERGGTDAQALTMGWLAGAAETLFEKVSLDSLIKTKTPDSWKTALGNILKQGLTEGSEEVSTSLANSLAEEIVMGDKSQLKLMERDFMEQGMSREEAQKAAKQQWLVGILADFIGGAVSGGLFGAGGNITTAVQNRGQNQQDAKKEDAAPFKAGAVENGEPGGEAPSAESVIENVDTVNENIDTVVGDNKNVIRQEGQIATEPAAAGNNKVSDGIQWAGNTPAVETERVVTNERTEQQAADLGQSGNQGRDAGYSDGISGQSPKRAALRAAFDRAEEARRVQSNVYAVGGRLTSLQEEGLTEGSQDRILTTVERDAWTSEVEEAAEIAAGEGLEFVPLMGNMQVLAPNGKTVTITGAVKNGKIYARADSTRQSIREIVLHESFHERQRKDPGLVKRIKKKIQETYTREETQAMFERYADLYQDAFADLTDKELQNAIWEEMLADAYAEFQRYSDTFGTAAWATDVQDEIWSGKQIASEDTIEMGAKFSISETDDGRPVAVVDSDILSSIDTASWNDEKKDAAKKAAKEALLQFKEGIRVGGITYKVNKVSRDEYTRSNETERVYRQSPDVFADKMRVAANADDVVTATTSWARDGGLKHPRKDKLVDFTRGDVLIQAGENQYAAETVVGITDKGEYVFYDVVDLEPTKFGTKKEPSTAAAGNEAVSAIQEGSYEDSVAKKNESVNTKFSVETSEKRDIREELSELVKPGLISGPHAVPRVETEAAGHIVRPEGMSDEAYAELDAKWQARHRSGRDAQGLTPVDELIIPKASYTATPAMDKLNIKVDGSVTRYRETEQLRAYEKAARQAKRMLQKRIKDLKPSGQEMYLARGLVDGNITVSALDDSNVDVNTITELADYLMASRSFSEDMIAQRRSEINTANLRIAEDLFEDAEAYNPKLKFMPGLTKIVMNERTPERVIKKIFGQEQGQKIYETYFRPVWVNGAEMNRFENRMLDRVAKFEDKNGTKRSLTEEERAMAQRLMEGEAARDNVARLDADTRERVESAAQNVNNGEEFVDAIREFGLAEEYHQGLVQAYADYLDTVTMSKDMDQTILKNAITTYRQIYNEMYDAINDFLVSHGYSEIGFIKGYAPHFQKRDAQQGLFGALKALGVEKESVSELPASIAGRTADFKPNMKWNPHMQGRKGSQTSYDIQMGYEQYLHYAAEMFYHTDDVMRIRQAVNWFRGQYSGEDISMAIEDAQVDRYKSTEWKQEFLEKQKILEPGQRIEARAINKLYDQYVEGLYERAKPENLQKYSEFVTWLDNYANIVAGKQSLADRGLEYGGGRNALNLGSKLMRAFSSANVAGNLSSVLNQSAQLPLIQQQLGTYLERAIFDMARGGIAKDNFVERSDFLTDKRGVDKLTVDGAEKFISGLFKPAELMDRLVSTLAVRGRYLQALSEGMSMEDAMKAADDFGRRVMGSRMKGAKPLGFESKTFVNQMLHVFQVEAANTFDYMALSDMPQAIQETAKKKGKAAAARHTAGYIVGYLLNAFLLNQLTDKLYGGSPAPFDLIGWALNFAAGGFGRTDEEFLKTLIDNVWEKLFGERPFETEEIESEEGIHWAGSAENLGYNVLNDVPYVRNIMGLMGWGDQTLPTVGVNELADHLTSAGGTLLKQLFLGEEETGISWAGAARESAEDIASAIAMVAPGGRQFKKTIQGIMTVAQGGRYYGDRLQYPVDRSIWNAIQAGLFGPSALEAADAYYAAEMSSLTAGQTRKVAELEAMGVNRFVTYDLYQEFREINKDLTGAEASTAKRNAINNLDLTDQEKLEVYSTFIMDRASESYGKNREQFQAMLDAGLTWNEVTQAHNLQAVLNEDEGLKAAERATEFAKWIDQQGWNKKQEAAVKEKFKFWQMIPAQAANYEKFENAGVDPEKAADLTKILDDLKPEDGKETVSLNQKILAIDRSKLSDEEKVAAISALVPDKRERLVEAGVSDRNARDIAAELAIAEAENGDEELSYLQKASIMIYQTSDDEEALAAVSTVLQESTYQKVELANSYGVPVEYWVDYREAWMDTYGEDSVSQEKVEHVLDGMMLSDSQKAVLWQIANKSWKPKNNPYDKWIGEEIYDELNEE